MPFVHLIIIYQESATGKKAKNMCAFKKYSDRFTRYELFYDTSKTSNAVYINYFLITLTPNHNHNS